MTDDLVKRLWDNCSCNFPDAPCGAEEQCRNAFEAADRIEELEAALRELSEDWDCCAVSKNMKLIAHKALENNND